MSKPTIEVQTYAAGKTVTYDAGLPEGHAIVDDTYTALRWGEAPAYDDAVHYTLTRRDVYLNGDTVIDPKLSRELAAKVMKAAREGTGR